MAKGEDISNVDQDKVLYFTILSQHSFNFKAQGVKSDFKRLKKDFFTNLRVSFAHLLQILTLKVISSLPHPITL